MDKVYITRTVVAMVGMLLLAGNSNGYDIGGTIKLGTTGFGADASVNLMEKLNLRAGINYFSHTFKFDDDDDGDTEENISVKLELQGIPILLDWHPFENNFRASAGLVINGNKLKLSAKAGDTIEINDVEYRIEDFSIDVDFNTLCPYLGIGYGNAVSGSSRFVFALDFGIMFQGAPSLKAKATASNPALQAQLDRDLNEEVKDFEDDLKPLGFFPVLTAGVAYRF